MNNDVLKRELFQRYARQQPMAPAPRPMAPAPTGIMASSPELMQAYSNYPPAQVKGYRRGTTVRLSQENQQPPAEEVVTEQTETVEQGGGPMQFGYTADGVAQEVEKFTGGTPESSEIDEAIKIGEGVENGNVTPPQSENNDVNAAAAAVADPKKTDNEKADAILKGAGKTAPKGTKNKILALKETISEVFGVNADRYNSLKQLNRAMVGFAIARTGDIAGSLEKGTAGLMNIENQRMARDDKMSEMALSQAFAEKIAAMKGSGTSSAFNKSRNPINAYQDAYASALKLAEEPLVQKKLKADNMTPEEYAHNAAMAVVGRSYSEEQLAGTQFAPVDVTEETVVKTEDSPELPTVTTQEEYDALPPDTEFIQNGQKRKKP